MRAFSSANHERTFGMSEGGQPGTWLGPTVTFTVPSLSASDTSTSAAAKDKESAPATPQDELGNGSFKRTAASLDVQKSELARPSDLSRQFETVVGNSSVAPAVPISGWTIISIAGMVALIVLAISFHQRDSRRRKHRHRHRHRHHEDDHHHDGHHRHRRRSHGEA
jgi:hypothetical protein